MERWDGAHCSRGYKYKKNSNHATFFKAENVIKTRKTEKSCPINLSGKCVDMVACSIVLFSTLRRQVFLKFLATGGANRLYKVELNTKVLLSFTKSGTKVLLSFTKSETCFKHCLSSKKIFLLQEWNTFHTRERHLDHNHS